MKEANKKLPKICRPKPTKIDKQAKNFEKSEG